MLTAGDPEPTSIVLWTRVTPHNLLQETSFTPVHEFPAYPVTYQVCLTLNLFSTTMLEIMSIFAEGSKLWLASFSSYKLGVVNPFVLQVATDNGFSNIVKNGSINATKFSDYTVKVIADGLTPATSYFYQFIVPNGTTTSPVGKFR